MYDRLNTIVCIFDPRSPRISAFDIHEWIHDKLRLVDADIRMIQVDGPRRHVYIKFTNEDRVKEVLQDSHGQLEYMHDNGEISQVCIELAGMGIKKIRIAGLPPEVKEHTLKECLATYGEIKSIRDELWAGAYRYKVYNGIRIAETKLKRHIPSHISIAGNNALISYDGQPATCYRCNEIGHMQIDCPRKKRLDPPTIVRKSNWADIASQATQRPQLETNTQESSSVLENRPASPIRLQDRPTVLSQCIHPLETRGEDGNKDRNIPQIGSCTLNPEPHPMDTQETDVGSGNTSVNTSEAERVEKLHPNVEMTTTSRDRTDGEVDALGTQ